MRRFFATSSCAIVLFLLPFSPGASFAQLSFDKSLIDSKFAGAYSVFAVDLDRDGKEDVLASGGSGLAWWKNNGNGSFSKRTIGSLSGAWWVYAADIDRDGDYDVLGASPTLNKVQFFQNKGGESFNSYVVGENVNAETVFAADLDGDNDLDVLAADWANNDIVWWKYNGGHSFTKYVVDSNLNGAHSVTAADFDRDGDSDVAASGSRNVNWYRNNGTGSFSSAIAVGKHGALCIHSTDFDQDGNPDILGTGRQAGDVYWYEGHGGSFSKHTIATGFGDSWSVHAADIDGDGDMDATAGAIWQNYVKAWINDGSDVRFREYLVDGNINSARAVWAADLDGDGDADITSAARKSGQVAWYEVSGGSGSPTIVVSSPNGGESWTAGSSRQISWAKSGGVANVQLEYSTDGGSTWASITSNTANDGTYSWTVPDALSSQCLLRISDATDGDPVDVSDGVFSTVAAASPALSLTAPNGGESWAIGSSQSITWSWQGLVGAVRLEYSTDSGTSWATIVASTANEGSYRWTIPEAPSSQCLVRIAEATDGDPVDASDAVFEIAPSLAVTDYALSFDGVDDYVEIADNAVLCGGAGKSITVEAWVKLVRLRSMLPIAMKVLDTKWKDWGMIVANGRLAMEIENSGDNWSFSAGSVGVGVWTHVAMAFDNANNVVRLFLNGIEAGSTSFTKDMPDTRGPVWFGRNTYAGELLVGLLDEVRIWNHARSSAELRGGMNQMLSGSEVGLIGYWRLNEGSGQAIVDLTDNGSAGRLGSVGGADGSDPQWVLSDVPVSTGSGAGVAASLQESRDGESALSALSLPGSYALHQNYPNPFNPETHIAYDLPERGHVRLTVHDVLGHEVRVLVDGELSAGRHRAIWDGRDGNGEMVSSGVYFYRLQVAGRSATRKMLNVQ